MKQKTLLVLVSRGPGRPQYENDTGGCGTLFLMGGGGGEGKPSAQDGYGRLQALDFHKSCSDVF